MIYTSLGTVSFTKTVFGFQPRRIIHLGQDSGNFCEVSKNLFFFLFYFSKLIAAHSTENYFSI